MNPVLVNHSNPVSAPVVTRLPVADSDRQARLAARIAGSACLMGLNVYETNACVRIGLVRLEQGSTLIGAYDHAIKVARRIILIKQKEKEADMAAQDKEDDHPFSWMLNDDGDVPENYAGLEVFMKSRLAAHAAYIDFLKGQVTHNQKTKRNAYVVALLAVGIAVYQWLRGGGCGG